MSDLIKYAADLEGIVDGQAGGPPVDKWTPPLSGDMDLVIRRDGVWLHEGVVMTRARLVRAFSTILKREGADYFLVTPHEKWRIKVEDVPFMAVLMHVEGIGPSRRIIISTNVGDQVQLGTDHPLTMRVDKGERVPYVDIRAGLEAKIARSVYYDLVALGEVRSLKGEDIFGVYSGDVFFPFGAARDIFPEDETDEL